jgi:hypothetical protein
MSWLKYRGVVLPKRTRKKKNGSYHKTETIDKLAVVELLRGELPDDVRQMLRNRAEASKAASLAKLNRVEPMVGTDGRLRFALNYCGAHTGRWTSEGLQLHNLPKNQLTAAASALVRDLVEAEDPQGLEMVEARPLEALSQMLRSVVVAPPGRELIGADFSAIEARVCAWLAGQDDVTAFFHEFDAQRRAGGKPKDFYVFTAESIDSDERQLGKVAALALQYGMGDVTFAGTAAKWGVPLTLLRARQVKLSWRLANRCIAQWWRDLEDAAFAAVLEPGSRHRAGRVSFRSTGKVLLMRLPSGRCIRYWQPSIVLKTRVFQLVDDEGKQVQKSVTREELQFWKPARGAMVAETTYGGKLCVAAGTKVFTGRGWVPIQNVLSDDLVHDGVEFVRHGGKVFNGEKQCCSVDGVLMTRDHEVLTDEGWQAASQDPRPIRLPLWLLDGAETGSQRRQKAFLALSLRLRKAESQGRIRRAAGVEARRNAELRLQDRSADRSGEHQARHDRAPDLLGVALDARPVPAPDASVLEELRRSGDTSLSPVARLREFPGGYVADLSRGLVDRAPRQQPRVQPRELHVGDAGRSSVQPAKQRVRPIEGKTPYRGADGPRNGDRRDDSALSDRARLASDEAADASGPDEPRRVFDIQNCGPRQRFVVLGVRGPFLVHNCENAVQAVARELLAAGLVQLDGVAPYELVIHVHDSAAAEVPEGMGDPVDFADRLAAAPPWVAGCPVAAEGWRDRRFRG